MKWLFHIRGIDITPPLQERSVSEKIKIIEKSIYGIRLGEDLKELADNLVSIFKGIFKEEEKEEASEPEIEIENE